MKGLLRSLYAGVCALPPMSWVIQRELARMGAGDWTAHQIQRFIEGDAGAAYGVDAAARRKLVTQFQAITGAIESGTAPVVHTILAEAILSIPPEVKGDVVECGCWKGASSASLSLVCALTGRRLKVCDSFQGLPDDGEQRHVGLHTGVYGHYKAGMFKGAREEVVANIEAYGDVSVCDFVEGFFDASLSTLRDPVAFVFLDVDLVSSTQDCLKALWPLLVEGGYIYADDAGDLDVVKVYFNDAWWQEHLGCEAPGFVGSGCGLPLSPTYSAIGYTRKVEEFNAKDWRKADFLYYPE